MKFLKTLFSFLGAIATVLKLYEVFCNPKSFTYHKKLRTRFLNSYNTVLSFLLAYWFIVMIWASNIQTNFRKAHQARIDWVKFIGYTIIDSFSLMVFSFAYTCKMFFRLVIKLSQSPTIFVCLMLVLLRIKLHDWGVSKLSPPKALTFTIVALILVFLTFIPKFKATEQKEIKLLPAPPNV